MLNSLLGPICILMNEFFFASISRTNSLYLLQALMLKQEQEDLLKEQRKLEEAVSICSVNLS